MLTASLRKSASKLKRSIKSLYECLSSEIRTQLTGETKASGDSRHDGRHQVVKITVGGGGELKGTEADVVQGLVINAESLVRVLDKLMNREGGVVGLDNGVRNLGRRHNGESAHHTVGVFLTDLGDQKSSHSGTSTTTEGVSNLETYKMETKKVRKFSRNARLKDEEKETYPGGSRKTQLPCGQHRGLSQPTQHLRCNVPLPN